MPDGSNSPDINSSPPEAKRTLSRRNLLKLAGAAALATPLGIKALNSISGEVTSLQDPYHINYLEVFPHLNEVLTLEEGKEITFNLNEAQSANFLEKIFTSAAIEYMGDRESAKLDNLSPDTDFVPGISVKSQNGKFALTDLGADFSANFLVGVPVGTKKIMGKKIGDELTTEYHLKSSFVPGKDNKLLSSSLPKIEQKSNAVEKFLIGKIEDKYGYDFTFTAQMLALSPAITHSQQISKLFTEHGKSSPPVANFALNDTGLSITYAPNTHS